MARDWLLEEMVRDALGDTRGLTEKAMFGGLCWLLDGRMLCLASAKGLMVRLGKGKDGWALSHPEIVTVLSGGKAMAGWVHVSPDASREDDALRRKLVAKAIAFVRALPPK
ncbi:cold-shock protein [Nostoc sp. 3335mG]|nr:cold-shock protein [Nostoc sp. 3335mG]